MQEPKASCVLPIGTDIDGNKPESVGQALEAAWSLISNKKHWIAGNFAETKDGKPVGSKDPLAHALCAIGAIQRVNGRYQKKAVELLNYAAVLQLPHGGVECNDSVIGVNDEKGYAAVRKMFKTAITMSRVLG
jgi:hypothetical protein